MTMTSRETRRAFLEFFAERGHRIVPSSPLVLPSDPTLLFANAGMNQFKDVFTGREKRDYVRAVSSQKCLRVSGKHNDLEEVGRTPRHHTFFEMLGNFSFGDYFKADAVAYAWELVTRVFGIPEDRLWVTVFEGSAAAPADEEADALWRERAGVRAERILRLGEKDNFWRMGDTGPCGPCSEIHFDLGADLTSVSGESNPATDSRRYVEIWNLVFMQFEQHGDGRLVPLPRPSIDTGMGLERITAVLQGKRSNYDTDLFQPILQAVAQRAGTAYGEDADADFSMRVIADHARALSFLVADGIVPANDNRGYVVRRVLRRAIRHGRKLGLTEPFLSHVTPAVLETLGDVYPELIASREAILAVGRREEERFGETLAVGLEHTERAIGELRGQTLLLPGEEVFRLYDTFGVPMDVIQDIAQERGIEVDLEGFQSAMQQQRARARASWKGGKAARSQAHVPDAATTFLGYDALHAEGLQVVALDPPGEAEEGTELTVYLDRTPFYAESGGQVGDTGLLVGGDARLRVLDTFRAGAAIGHRARVEAGTLHGGAVLSAEVDAARRRAVMRNHTATHLLHAALREVVGTHVKQAGSLVAPDRLRFDFSHFAGMSERALSDVESLVNAKVLEDLAVETDVRELEDALRSGAMALFGEKYGERVRVVRIGDFSLELCGGTHVGRCGEIGLVKLTGERGVAAGTRRVEAISGEASLHRFREEDALVRAVAGLAGSSREELVAELARRLDQVKALQRELAELRRQGREQRVAEGVDEAENVEGVRFFARRVDGVGKDEARALADTLRRKLGSGVVVLGRAEEGKASILVAVTEDLTDRLPAGDLVRELAAIIGGGGGGRKDMAEAGGKDAAKLDQALRSGREAIARRLKAKV
ncbi:MAG TPA: alanine--tRNA ligase [Candidatus Polarisedimenticolaceae bacterium]|nr:alanine--tRNA ligase [Candidatus Polarisedimenticolaceae bacterium]